MRKYKYFGLLTLVAAPLIANLAFNAASKEEASQAENAVAAPVVGVVAPAAPIAQAVPAPVPPAGVTTNMLDPAALTQGIDPTPALDPTPPGSGSQTPPIMMPSPPPSEQGDVAQPPVTQAQ